MISEHGPVLRDESRRSFDPDRFASLAAVEDRHFWFSARNRLVATIAAQLSTDLEPGYRVLEVGTGTGNVLRFLERACPGGWVCGVDLFAEGLRYARQRARCPLVQADVLQLPFGEAFDLIGLFDVLEHLTDDVRALDNLHGALRPGGRLLLTVPAHRYLWSYFDEASCHARRYHPAELRARLEQTGFRIDYLTQYMAALFPLVWCGRRIASFINRRSSRDPTRARDLATRELTIVPVLNGVLKRLLTLEMVALRSRRTLPLGISLLAIGRKA